MPVSTTVGPSNPVVLADTKASAMALTQFQTTSLCSPDPFTITVTGGTHTVAFIGNTNADDGLSCQINIYVDSVLVVSSAANTPITVQQSLAQGTHTVSFQAVSFVETNNLNAAGLFIIDLGL